MIFVYPDGSDHAATPPKAYAIDVRCTHCDKPIFGTASLDLFVHAHKVVPSKRRSALCAICGLGRSSMAHP